MIPVPFHPTADLTQLQQMGRVFENLSVMEVMIYGDLDLSIIFTPVSGFSHLMMRLKEQKECDHSHNSREWSVVG
jgi:hypothetical protein